MLLIPRGEGVETKPIRTAYSAAAGTTYVTFDNVKVPVENTLGKVDEGLKVALANFNHERWSITIEYATITRVVLAECFKWASQRKVCQKPR